MPAAHAGLVYVNDCTAGWRRVRRGRGFAYLDEQGRPIRAPGQLDRIRSLAIPPAYTDVWICPDPAGHLQATGRDAKGRKQYRYHRLWKELRNQAKFDRLLEFGHALPTIRRAVARDLAHKRLSLDTVTAAIVRLLDRAGLRVGNDEYSARNGSYGLTTLRHRHAKLRGNRLMLHFKGKSQVEQQLDICDGSVARIARRCQELPGQRLFQFLDEEGRAHQVRSDHVNAYIRTICHKDFTAKDFRTWHASACAMALALQSRNAAPASVAHPPLDAAEAVKQVARRLGNSCAVCRRFYIHPEVLKLFQQDMPAMPPSPLKPRKGLSTEERALLQLLECRSMAIEPVSRHEKRSHYVFKGKKR